MHLAEFPSPPTCRRGATTRSSTRWERLIDIRNAVNAALELKRQDKTIGTSLGARVEFRAGGETAELLDVGPRPAADAVHRVATSSSRRTRRRDGSGSHRPQGRRGEVPALLAVVPTSPDTGLCDRCTDATQPWRIGGGLMLPTDPSRRVGVEPTRSAPRADRAGRPARRPFARPFELGSIALIVILDQITKALVRANLPLGDSRHDLPGLARPDARAEHRRGVRAAEQRRLSLQGRRHDRRRGAGAAGHCGLCERSSGSRTAWPGSGSR